MVRLSEAARVDICAWLEANGIRGRDIPIDTVPDVPCENQTTVDVFDLDEHGRVRMDETGIRTVRLTFTVSTPRSPLVTAWLRGHAS